VRHSLAEPKTHDRIISGNRTSRPGNGALAGRPDSRAHKYSNLSSKKSSMSSTDKSTSKFSVMGQDTEHSYPADVKTCLEEFEKTLYECSTMDKAKVAAKHYCEERVENQKCCLICKVVFSNENRRHKTTKAHLQRVLCLELFLLLKQIVLVPQAEPKLLSTMSALLSTKHTTKGKVEKLLLSTKSNDWLDATTSGQNEERGQSDNIVKIWFWIFLAKLNRICIEIKLKQGDMSEIVDKICQTITELQPDSAVEPRKLRNMRGNPVVPNLPPQSAFPSKYRAS
jgi:hypothetical protein